MKLRYRSLFEDNHSVMVLSDRASGEIVDVNPAAAAYYGWSRAQMRTMSVFDVHALPPAEVRAEERAQMRKGATITGSNSGVRTVRCATLRLTPARSS